MDWTDKVPDGMLRLQEGKNTLVFTAEPEVKSGRFGGLELHVTTKDGVYPFKVESRVAKWVKQCAKKYGALKGLTMVIERKGTTKDDTRYFLKSVISPMQHTDSTPTVETNLDQVQEADSNTKLEKIDSDEEYQAELDALKKRYSRA